MPNDRQLALLTDISQSVAFGDDRHGEVNQLIIDGYVKKDGDLFELTPLGEKTIIDQHPEVHDP